MRVARALAMMLWLAPQGLPAMAQQARPAASAATKPADALTLPAELPPAPYEREILRLSEIIGSLAFLRALCAAPDAAQWPQRMQALLEVEGAAQNRRERLAGAYNRGYRAFSLTYRSCTASAGEASERYLKEGNALSQTLSSRYGG